MILIEHILAAVTTFFSAVLGGFTGGGGGALSLSFMVLLFPDEPYISILAAFKAAVIFWCIVSSAVHWKVQTIDWKLFWTAGVASVLGVSLGTYLVQNVLPPEILIRSIPFVLIFIAITLTFSKKDLKDRPHRRVTLLSGAVLFLFFFCMNTANAMMGGLGLLGSFFLVRYMRVSYILAAAYTFTLALMRNTPQSIYLLATEPIDLWLLVFVALGGMLGSYCGTKLQYLKGNKWVKAVALIAMVGIAIQMILV